MKRKVKYRANNPKVGFRAGELKKILEKIDDMAVIRVVSTVGLKQIPKEIEVEEEID